MNKIRLYDKEHVLKRIEYVKGLNYSDHEYTRAIRRHIIKYGDKARGLLNTNSSAEDELTMFEAYGFVSLKRYTLDTLTHNSEYCDVLELDSHDKQVKATIDFLESTNNIDYMLDLSYFATKIEKVWYIPIDRIINWVDCFMIQKEFFELFAKRDEPLVLAPNYFTENVLIMLVYTDNDENSFNKDIDSILTTYNKLIKGLSDILNNLPNDRMIDDLFNMSKEKMHSNAKYVNKLAKEYVK